MDIVYEEAARLLYNYSVNNKIADHAFCMKITNLLAHAFNVNDYFTGIVTDNKKELTIASYSPIEKNITINLDYFNTEFLDYVDVGSLKDEPFKYYYYINYSVFKTLVHEMTHAYQFKMVYKDKINSLEKNLYQTSFKVYSHIDDAIRKSDIDLIKTSNYDPFYYKMYIRDRLYYYSLPSERIASINGARAAKDVTQIVTKDKELNQIATNELLNRAFIGYTDYSPSTYVFAINSAHEYPGQYQNSIDAMEKIENSLYGASMDNNLSFTSRLMFGLPLTKEEKEENIESIDKSKKFLKRQITRFKKAI